MKTADLYIRVSTDEQADKGYSQRNQEEVLRRYCEANSIRVRKVIYEDHSAKSFVRPEWTKLLLDLRKNRNTKPDLILFTKWDRFSRNAPDAYQMINTLRKLDVEPQAVEQPLDLSIPENKMMLAIYLTSGEVENDRRALNVFYGMRRAKKEGRWMGTAPIGYINKVYENGHKYIAPKDKEADIMRWVFKSISEEIFNTEQIWRLAKQKGLKCSKNNFWVAIRNPIYCGKIFIPKYKDEESRFVNGQHEPLINEALFFQAQDVLNGRGRKKISKPKIVSEDLLPLRGFVNCPKCNRALTGSASKGRNQYYYYYHCLPSCGFRQKAEVMNAAFLLELKKYVPHHAVAELFKSIIQDVNKNQTQNSNNERRHVINQIEEQNARVTKSRNLLLADAIEPADYKLIKAEAEEKINSLEARIAAYNVAVKNIDKILNTAAGAISSLDLLYETGNTKQKREIIGSIFSDKLVFENGAYRTAKVNEAAELIYVINNDLQSKKNGTSQDFSRLSHKVNSQGLEPWTR
jgi:site-specific DNA recombinase